MHINFTPVSIKGLQKSMSGKSVFFKSNENCVTDVFEKKNSVDGFECKKTYPDSKSILLSGLQGKTNKGTFSFEMKPISANEGKISGFVENDKAVNIDTIIHLDEDTSEFEGVSFSGTIGEKEIYLKLERAEKDKKYIAGFLGDKDLDLEVDSKMFFDKIKDLKGDEVDLKMYPSAIYKGRERISGKYAMESELLPVLVAIISNSNDIATEKMYDSYALHLK